MAFILLGAAVGFFMSAFINHKFNTGNTRWIKTKYLIFIAVITLILSIVLYLPDTRP